MDLGIYIEILALFVLGIVFLLSILGCFIPVIPGPLLAFLGILVYKLVIPKSMDSWDFVLVCGVVTAISQVLDMILTCLGAKMFGATWKGTLGAVVGVVVGMFIPPQFIWIFLAPILFAFVFEFLGGRNILDSGKAGIGAFVGSILSTALKIGIVLAMIVGFFCAIDLVHIS